MPRFNPLKSSEPATSSIHAPASAPTSAPSLSRLAPTLTDNKAKDGIELRFPAKPAAEVLDQLKANGWRWSRFSSCWYQRNTPEQRAFAEQFLDRGPAVPPSTTAAPTNVLPIHFQPPADFQPAIQPVPAWKRAMLGRLSAP